VEAGFKKAMAVCKKYNLMNLNSTMAITVKDLIEGFDCPGISYSECLSFVEDLFPCENRKIVRMVVELFVFGQILYEDS